MSWIWCAWTRSAKFGILMWLYWGPPPPTLAAGPRGGRNSLWVTTRARTFRPRRMLTRDLFVIAIHVTINTSAKDMFYLVFDCLFVCLFAIAIHVTINTSAMDMFNSVFDCLFVCEQLYVKTTERIFNILSECMFGQGTHHWILDVIQTWKRI